MIGQIVQELDLLEPGQLPAFISGWSMDKEDHYLFVPVHHTRKVRVFRLGERLQELPERWSTAEFVPSCIEHVRVADQTDYVMIADGEGRIYYPKMAGFITGEVGKWDSFVDLHSILKLRAPGRRDMDLWRLASYVFPDRPPKVFALGAYEDPDVGGFVQTFDLAYGSLEAGATLTRIEEAPYDIEFHDDRVFIACGRAGHIEVRNIHTPQKVIYTITSDSRPFKPAKLAVAPKRGQLWVASYDTLFWCDLPEERTKGRIQVTTGADCVGDFALSQDEERIYVTCTYSSRLCEVELRTFKVRDIPILGGHLQQPNWVKVLGRRVFVLGHSNGKLWALEIAANA